MPVTFGEFQFENQDNIDVTLTLEAPTGTPLVTTAVAAQKSYKFNPSVDGVSTAKITVVASGHEQDPDIAVVELRASPYAAQLTTLQTWSSIGSVHGVVSGQF